MLVPRRAVWVAVMLFGAVACHSRDSDSGSQPDASATCAGEPRAIAPSAVAEPTVASPETPSPSEAAAPSSIAPNESPRCGPISADSIHPLGGDRYALDRAALTVLLNHYGELAIPRDGRLIPEQVGGRVVGLRIFGIRQKGICILENADRIESIAGVPLTGPEAGASLRKRLEGATRFTVQVVRTGKSRTFEILVR